MREFKDCSIKSGRIILRENLTPERFRKFINDFYSSRIPIFKCVAVLDCLNTLQTIYASDHCGPDPLSILNMMDMYSPMHESNQVGQYVVEGTQINGLNMEIQKHKSFINRVQIEYKQSSVKTLRIFNSDVSQSDICQVYYYLDQYDASDYFPDISTLSGDLKAIAVNHWGLNRHVTDDNHIVRSHLKSFDSNEFFQWGYKARSKENAPRVKSLINLKLPMLYTHLSQKTATVTTPVFICYRGTGILTNAEIRKRLFARNLDFAKFYFPPVIRFSLQDYIGISQKYTANEIPYINIQENVDTEVLQHILCYYGKLD